MPEVAVNPAGEAAPVEAAQEAANPVSEGTEQVTDAQAFSESVDPVKQAQAKAKAEEEKPAEDPDPEIELDKDLKLRKSELTKAIKRRKELDRAAFEKFQQAAQVRKQLDALRDSDPEEYFRMRGVDPIQYAVERLQREVAMREATPEQRRTLELEDQLVQERAQREQYQSQVENERMHALRGQYAQKLDRELPNAMQKQGLHTDPLTFSLVAQQIRAQLMSDQPEDYELAAETVADNYRTSFKNHTATLKYEDAIKTYPELVKVIRDGDLARAKTALPVKNEASKPGAPRPATPAPKRDWPIDDWAASGIRVVK
jgi:hypothetical protein